MDHRIPVCRQFSRALLSGASSEGMHTLHYVNYHSLIENKQKNGKKKMLESSYQPKENRRQCL